MQNAVLEKKHAELLRTQHPTFYYQKYHSELSEHGLVLSFQYLIEPDFAFEHIVEIQGVTAEMLDDIPKNELDEYVFNIGMIELFSYWKTTCAAEIFIECHGLTEAQTQWWSSLLVKGMGEFFYVNGIDFTVPHFITISSNSTHNTQLERAPRRPSSREQALNILIPIGGGKDSLTTLELLKMHLRTNPHHGTQLGIFLVNPPDSAVAIARTSGLSSILEVKRVFDPELFKLNSQGYLNGHVPVSASIAFISLLSARLFGYSHVALSNERSSNEGNVLYKGHTINHQYSKTYEFERSFQEYIAEGFASFETTPFYFSFLRPLFELQIANIFASHCTEYFSLFRSCNRGQKTNTWCTECPKCLFAFIILFPWLGEEKTVEIFGTNLFERDSLVPQALELLGKTKQKPFECVGTVEETEVALGLSMQTYKEQAMLPPLLMVLQKKYGVQSLRPTDQKAERVLKGFDNKHSLSEWMVTLLKEHVL